MDNENNVINFQEYNVAKKATKELPIIKHILDDMKGKLNKYKVYKIVAEILWAVRQSEMFLDAQLKYYNGVLKAKEKDNGPQNSK